MTSNIELWCNGEMIGRGNAALAQLPDTSAQRQACADMYRVQAKAVEAQERCDAAERRRDRAQAEQRLAEQVVDAAQSSLISTLCDRAAALGRRLDKMERKRTRKYLDSLPDPDNPGSGSGLTTIGPTETERYNPADQIPEPKDPLGLSLEL
jgi:hypothetical protein